MFKRENITYNPRNIHEFETERKRTEYFGLETLSYRSPQSWSLLLEHMRQINSLHQFKESVRQWVCNPCPCRLCTCKMYDFYKSSVNNFTWQRNYDLNAGL